ncbi:UNVERIFIED_CONTAM: hypothetical protein GTU68_067365 [Idotea baltica]|nr:hypothetical protein [Idotea baltica]
MRILFEVYEEFFYAQSTPQEVSLAESPRQRDLPQSGSLYLRGGWQHQQNLLPELVSTSQAIPRPQDSLLRRRTVSVLRSDQE